MIDPQSKLSFKVIQIINDELQPVTDITNILLKLSDTDTIVGGNKYIFYKYTNDYLNRKDQSIEYKFESNNTAITGFTLSTVSSVENLSDGYYRIAYDLKEPVQNVRIFINDGSVESEYSKEILFDYDEVKLVLNKSSNLTNILNYDTDLKEFTSHIPNVGGQIAFKKFLPELPILDTSKVEPSLFFSRGRTGLDLETGVATTVVNTKITRIANIDNMLTRLADINLPTSWSTAFLNTVTSISGLQGQKTLKIITSSAISLNLPATTYLLLENNICELASPATIGGTTTVILSLVEPLKRAVSISSPSSLAYYVLPNGNAEIREFCAAAILAVEQKFINFVWDLKKTLIADTTLAIRSLALALRNERTVLNRELLDQTNHLQEVRINNISNISSILKLQLHITLPTVIPTGIVINSFELACFTIPDNTREDNLNMGSVSRSEYVKTILASTTTYLDFQMFPVYYKDKHYKYYTHSLTLTGSTGNYYLNATALNDAFSYSYFKDKVIIIEDKIYDVSGLGDKNEGITPINLFQPLHKNITSSDTIKIRSKYQEDLELFPSVVVASFPVSVDDRFLIFMRAVDQQGNKGGWSDPMIFDVRNLPIGSLYPTLNAYLAEYVNENINPTIATGLEDFSVPPSVIDISDTNKLTISYYDGYAGEETSITDDKTSSYRADLTTAIAQVSAKELAIKGSQLDYAVATTPDAKTTAYNTLKGNEASLRDSLRNVLDLQYLVNMDEGSLNNRYFAKVILKTDATLPKGQTLQKYQCKIVSYNTTTSAIIEGTERIIEGPIIAVGEYNPLSNSYTYQGSTNASQSPEYCRTFRIPILPGKTYKLYISVISSSNLSSAWQTDTNARTVTLVKTELPDGSIKSVLGYFIDAQVKMNMLDVKSDLNIIKNDLLNVQTTSTASSTSISGGTSTSGIVDSKFAIVNTKTYIILKYIYNQNAGVYGLLNKVSYLKKNASVNWKTVYFNSIIHYEALTGLSGYDATEAPYVTWEITSAIIEEYLRAFYSPLAMPLIPNGGAPSICTNSGNFTHLSSGGFSALISQLEADGWKNTLASDAALLASKLSYTLEQLNLSQYTLLTSPGR
jgi:hypothetical protein